MERNGDGTNAAHTESAFLSQMTSHTDIDGNASNVSDTTYRFGPYLRKGIPPMTFGPQADNTGVRVVTGATESGATVPARGFSMMELILVILIVAIISAVVVPRFGGSITRHRADTVAQRIALDLELARRRASTTSAAQRVSFDVADDSYRLDGLSDMDHSTETYIVSVAEQPYEAILVFVDFGGDDEIVFDGFGMPDSGGSAIVQVGNEIRTVTVDADTGAASVSGS